VEPLHEASKGGEHPLCGISISGGEHPTAKRLCLIDFMQQERRLYAGFVVSTAGQAVNCALMFVAVQVGKGNIASD